jgi:hypothetical protein
MPANVTGWLANLTRFGPAHSQWISQHRDDPDQGAAVGAVYYDLSYALRVCGAWLGDPSYTAGADAAHVVYRHYIDANAGGVPPNSMFARGLAWQSVTNNDWGTRATLRTLAAMQYAAASTPTLYLAHNDARNLAYAADALLYSHLLQADPPAPDQPLRDKHYDLVCLELLTRLRQLVDGVPVPPGYALPFMVGLACRSLIDRHEYLRTRKYDAWTDPETARVLATVAGWVWAKCVRADGMGVTYADRDLPNTEAHTGASPDLNMMMLPIFAWLAWTTGDWHYRDRGDALFNWGVAAQGNLDKPKQFCESVTGVEEYLVFTNQAPKGRQTVLARVMAV